MTHSFQGRTKIKTAVITGHHPYEVTDFHLLFRSVPEIDFYPQNMEDFVTDTGKGRKQYDVLVFYNMHMETPVNKTKEVLEQLGETEQGILMLHHAILAFPKWQLWSDICGIQDRSFDFYPEQSIRIEIANHHPITESLTSWKMIDETYTMKNAGESNEIILITDHPKSIKTIAWTRHYRKARIFCYQSGHDSQTYSNPQFRTVLARGIQWLAGSI